MKQVWKYTINHHWSKDILRANVLFVALVVIYQLLHFHLQPIHFGLFVKSWLLLNVCQFFKAWLNRY